MIIATYIKTEKEPVTNQQHSWPPGHGDPLRPAPPGLFWGPTGSHMAKLRKANPTPSTHCHLPANSSGPLTPHPLP